MPTKIILSVIALLLLCGVIAACSPLRAINALTPASTYVKTSGIAYGIAYDADPRQQLDIYVPRNLNSHQAKNALPVAVFFYGGNWNSGDRESYTFVGEALASRGIIAVIADYRLYPQVHYPELLDDSAKAVAWTFQHIAQYGGDAQRVFVVGHSAGAYNAAMVALDKRLLAKYSMSPKQLRGWIGLAGPYNFIPIENKDTRPVFFFPNTPKDSQPLYHVSREAPRGLLIAASKDKLVDPQRNSATLAKALKDAGVPTELILLDEVSHTTLVGALSRPLRGLAPVLDKIEAFVKAR
jgi:acetyl esterase/lipase